MKHAILVAMLLIMPAQAHASCAFWFFGCYHHRHHLHRYHHHIIVREKTIVHEKTIIEKQPKPTIPIPLDPVK